MHEALVDGVRIAYSVAGAGPPLVLLHGGMDDSRSWRWQLEGLCDEFRVLAWDAPGCGQSSEPPETWRMPEYADCLAAWLQMVGAEQPHVLGLSWGSSVALELYRRHPEVPASLILASAYAGWAGSLPPEEVDARLESVLAAADLPLEELLQGWPGLLTRTASAERVDELVSIWAANAGTVHPAGYRAMAHSMAEADLRGVLPRIEVPPCCCTGSSMSDPRCGSPPSLRRASQRRSWSSSRVLVTSATPKPPTRSTLRYGSFSGASIGER